MFLSSGYDRRETALFRFLAHWFIILTLDVSVFRDLKEERQALFQSDHQTEEGTDLLPVNRQKLEPNHLSGQISPHSLFQPMGQILKGTVPLNFSLQVFLMNYFPPSPDISIAPFQIFATTPGDIRKSRSTTIIFQQYWWRQYQLTFTLN
jgi:hypothetical protein